MSKRWTVGSLVPGQETQYVPRKLPVHEAKTEIKKQAEPKKQVVSPAIKVKQGNTVCSVSLQPGTILLDAALKQGCDIQYKCRKGTCGACTVDILSGSGFLSGRNSAELKKLGESEKRLACQAVIK